MTDEEKKRFFEISKRIGYKVGTYCNDEEIEVFEKILEDYKYKNNLIEKQQEEIEKKDKIIDEAIDWIKSLHDSLIEEYGTYETEFSANGDNIEENKIKEYFINKCKGVNND